MEYRRLGRYGLRVSAVSLGGWLTHGRSLEDSTTETIVKRAFELGINLFDTADAYNRGEAEISLAKGLNGIAREEVVLATKCYFPISDSPNDRGLSRKHITESVHKSLKRLQTDYIDIMQFHRWDSEAPLDETVRAIDDLVRQGKVLYWGVSEWKSHQIAEAVSLAKQFNANPPASNQPVYNMLNKYIEESVLPTCELYGLGLIVFSPLAQGILTGKYKPGQSLPEGSRGADQSSNQFMTRQLEDQALLQKVQDLKGLAESHGAGLAEFALAWCLRQKQVSSVIIGATTAEQVDQNVKAAGLSFPDDVWSQAAQILK